MLADPRTDASAAIASRLGVRPRIVSDFREAFDHIDAAIIATPNALHAPIALACVAAGKHLLIEKPMATTIADARAISAAASASGLIVAVGYVSRFRRNVRLMKRLLDSGRFGNVHRFLHQFGTVGGWAPESGYILDKKQSGGGVLMVTGTHFIDRAIHFWGSPPEIQFRDDATGGPEAHCELVLDYRTNGGPLGLAIYSKIFPLPGRLVLDTEAGYVVLDDNDDALISVLNERHHLIEQLDDPVADSSRFDPFYLQIEDFVDSIRRGRPPLVDHRQGLASIELISQAYGVRQLLPGTPWKL